MSALPSDDDLEPLVVMNDDQFAALPAVEPSPSPNAQDYLRSQGITDPRTWATFRLDAVTDADLGRLLTPRQRAHLTSGGIWLPTSDPREHATITGLVRLTPAQNQHRFVSAPAGIAAPADIDTATRVVLVDNPLLGMRLHERGVANVAIVEDPAVLVPLAPWLAARAVVTVTTAKTGVMALPEGITAVGSARIIGKLEQASETALSLLGLDASVLRRPISALPLEPIVVNDLHAYAAGRIGTAGGAAALAALGCDDPDVLQAYRLGHLPADFRQALTDAQRRMLLGKELGNTLIFPAFDRQGVVVDLVAAQVCDGGGTLPTLWDSPRGLCAPMVCTAFDRIVVTTVACWVGRLFRSVAPTILLRGVANAQAEAARIAAGGVRQAEVRCRTQAESEGVAEALRAAGIAARIVVDDALLRPGRSGTARLVTAEATATALPPVERMSQVPEAQAAIVTPSVSAPVIALPPVPVTAPPAVEPAAIPAAVVDSTPPALAEPSLELVSHDAQAEQAVFRYGPAVYTVQVPWTSNSTVEVSISVGSLKHRDRFDLAVAAQRLRCAATAGLRTKLPPATIARALELILPAVRRLVEPKAAQVAVVPDVPGTSAPERETALALLRSPDLLPRLLTDLGVLGADLAPDTATWAILASVSRLAPDPVWLALTSADPGERFPVLDVLARITPPEAQIHLSRLTDSALFHGEADGLRNKLLLLDDLAALTASAATALRVLHARGRITTSQVSRDVVRGAMRTRIVTAEGPIAVVAASAGDVPATLRHHLAGIQVDGQSDHPTGDLRRRLAPPTASEPIIRRLHVMQRLLQPLPVIVPETEPLDLPQIVVRDRVLHEACIALIAAGAILHQHQRPRFDGAVVAATADVALAVRLVLGVAEASASGLSPSARTLMQALVGAGRVSFTMEDCAELLPSWSRWAFRTALHELTRLDLVVPSRTGQGKRRTYTLLATRAPVELGGLAELGGARPPSATREIING